MMENKVVSQCPQSEREDRADWWKHGLQVSTEGDRLEGDILPSSGTNLWLLVHRTTELYLTWGHRQRVWEPWGH